jgi:hypothetical protein
MRTDAARKAVFDTSELLEQGRYVGSGLLHLYQLSVGSNHAARPGIVHHGEGHGPDSCPLAVGRCHSYR